jgi:hypothetical protein
MATVGVASWAMPSEYVAPSFQSDGFHCPHCGVYAHQRWGHAVGQGAGLGVIQEAMVSKCGRCQQHAFWVNGQLVHPPVLVAPEPHDDLPDPALTAYREARSIARLSPRAAAALLRLAIQLLVPELGATSDNLNAAIGELVKTGLSPTIQQSLDAVRVIGNNAVHPGQIDVNDDPEIALALFDLVNLIVQTMITDPRAAKALYDRLPPTVRNAIDQRDSGGSDGS